MVKGQFQQVSFFDSRALLRTLALCFLGRNWEQTVKPHFRNRPLAADPLKPPSL